MIREELWLPFRQIAWTVTVMAHLKVLSALNLTVICLMMLVILLPFLPFRLE